MDAVSLELAGQQWWPSLEAANMGPRHEPSEGRRVVPCSQVDQAGRVLLLPAEAEGLARRALGAGRDNRVAEGVGLVGLDHLAAAVGQGAHAAQPVRVVDLDVVAGVDAVGEPEPVDVGAGAVRDLAGQAAIHVPQGAHRRPTRDPTDLDTIVVGNLRSYAGRIPKNVAR